MKERPVETDLANLAAQVDLLRRVVERNVVGHDSQLGSARQVHRILLKVDVLLQYINVRGMFEQLVDALLKAEGQDPSGMD